MDLSPDRKRLLVFLGGVLLALVGLYLLAKRQNSAALVAPAAANPAAASMPTANYAVTLDSYNGPGYTPPAVAASPTAPPVPAQLPLALQGTGSAFPVQDNLAIVPQFPWG